MGTLITSIHNPRVKDAAGLRDRRHRRKQQLTLIDGVRELGRALASGVALREVFLCEPLCRSDESQRLWTALREAGVEILEVAEPVFERLAFGDRAEGVLGVAETPRRRLDDLLLSTPPLVVVLEGVEKPGNVGAVLRSADGAGVSALVTADARTDLYNPNAVRASLGTIFTMPVGEASGPDTLDWLRRGGIQIVAARVEGAVAYTEVDYRGPTAIVLGNEAEGLTPLWEAPDVRAVRIPMLGAADSLNVSAAAAVLCYEARRQRQTRFESGEAGTGLP